MGATQRTRLTVSDFDFQIKGQTARLYSMETHFLGGGGAALWQHAKICWPQGRLKSCLCLKKKDLFATIALKSFLTYLISIASFLYQQQLIRLKNKHLKF